MTELQGKLETGELASFLEDMKRREARGCLTLLAHLEDNSAPRSRLLYWNRGQIVYAGSAAPTVESLIKLLKQRLGRNWVDPAVTHAITNLENGQSVGALVDRLVRMKLLGAEDLQGLLRYQIILQLEQVQDYPCDYSFDGRNYLELNNSVEVDGILGELAKRQERYRSLAPYIQSGDIIPRAKLGVLSTLNNPKAISHLKRWANGTRSLFEIAEELGLDPLPLARQYARWIEEGFVTTASLTEEKHATILAVDDSAVTQHLLASALSDRYRVLTASSAIDAMAILHREDVAALVLDVNMPDINGLELCRTLRKIGKYQEIPIVMLTARDGWIDKVKGRISGATEYLTKPFEPEQLHQLLARHLNADSEDEAMDSGSLLSTFETKVSPSLSNFPS